MAQEQASAMWTTSFYLRLWLVSTLSVYVAMASPALGEPYREEMEAVEAFPNEAYMDTIIGYEPGRVKQEDGTTCRDDAKSREATRRHHHPHRSGEAAFQSQAADKRRLRFVRRGRDAGDAVLYVSEDAGPVYLTQPQRRAPRLRFQKRAAEIGEGSSSGELNALGDSSSSSKLAQEKAEERHDDREDLNDSADSRPPAKKSGSGRTSGSSTRHSRHRRSAMFPPSSLGSSSLDVVGKRTPKFSFNTDMDAIRSMVAARRYHERMGELNALTNRLLAAGKRSPTKKSTSFVTDLDVGSTNEDRGLGERDDMKSLKQSLAFLLTV